MNARRVVLHLPSLLGLCLATGLAGCGGDEPTTPGPSAGAGGSVAADAGTTAGTGGGPGAGGAGGGQGGAAGTAGAAGRPDAPGVDAGAPGDAGPPSATAVGVAAAITEYEAGTITRPELARRLATFPTSAHAEALRGAIDDVVLLRARPTPYPIAADLQIGPQGMLVLEAGAAVVIGPNVTVTIKGKLYALGTETAPVRIAGASKATQYRTLVLEGGRSEIVGAVFEWARSPITVNRTEDTPILIEASKIDNFSVSGVEMTHANKLVIKNNQIGVATKPEDARCEALHGSESAVRIEGNTFGRRTGYNDVFDLQPCKSPRNPLIIGNLFLGGDDDAIDLDDCDAIVIGNHLKDFRPDPRTTAGQANGGGVTGDGGNPIVINNVIENCVHALGFKDDAVPLIINNTLINNDIAITMYAAGNTMAATGFAYNNVLWNNKTDIQLDGKWFPAYNPNRMGSLEARSNVLRDPAYVGKDGNLGDDPLIEIRDGLPHLKVGSPARGSGLGDLALFASKGIFSVDQLRGWLGKDYLGTPRPAEGDKLINVDRGALQSK